MEVLFNPNKKILSFLYKQIVDFS